jgi:protein-tyrosine sulfotransferase
MINFYKHIIQRIVQGLGYRIVSNKEFKIPEHLILSNTARQTIQEITGSLLNGFIMIHGAIPRTGTNYLSSLISLHPDVIAHPNCTWEMPILACQEEWIKVQNHFYRLYPRNIENMGLNDIIGVSIASIFRLAAHEMEQKKKLLLKSPHISSAKWFHDIIPNGKLVLINRDGRDAVISTVNTWPKIAFNDACLRWVKGTRELFSTLREDQIKNNETFYVCFEDIVANPHEVMRELVPLLGINIDVYPFEKIESLPVSGSSQVSEKDGTITWNPIKKTKNFMPVGKWVEWDRKKKNRFKKIAGQTLIDAGYCSDLHW